MNLSEHIIYVLLLNSFSHIMWIIRGINNQEFTHAFFLKDFLKYILRNFLQWVNKQDICKYCTAFQQSVYCLIKQMQFSEDLTMLSLKHMFCNVALQVVIRRCCWYVCASLQYDLGLRTQPLHCSNVSLCCTVLIFHLFTL